MSFNEKRIMFMSQVFTANARRHCQHTAYSIVRKNGITTLKKGLKYASNALEPPTQASLASGIEFLPIVFGEPNTCLHMLLKVFV